MKKFLYILLSFVIVMIIAIALMFFKIIQDTNKLTFQSIDLTTIKDGAYQGSCDLNLVQVTVEVTILEHKIKDIQILQHQNGFGSDAEVITTTMVEKNTTDVDSISGATVSSKAIRSAVEQALTK